MRIRRAALPAIIAMALAGIPGRTALALTPNEIDARVKDLRATLQSVGRALNDAERTLAQTDVAIRSHAAAVRAAAVRREELRLAIGARASQLYMYASMEQVDILTGEGIGVYVDRMAYLEQMRRGERGLLEEVVALQRHADEESALLRAARAQAAKARATLSSRESELRENLAEMTRLQSYLSSVRAAARGSRSAGRGILCPVVGSNVPIPNFGDPRPGGPHQGNDIRANTGQWVRAVLPGTIVETPYGSWWGIGIVLRDLTGTEWWYAHLSAENVGVGEHVSSGELIGRVGCTGTCYGSHLHFEWHPGGGSARDPYGMLSSAC